MKNLLRKMYNFATLVKDTVYNCTHKSIGITTSDVMLTEQELQQAVDDKHRSKFRLKTSVTLHFNLLDISIDRTTKQPLYHIECIETADKFKLSKKLFTLLFERYNYSQDIFNTTRTTT